MEDTLILQDAGRRLVADNVLLCVSSLVYGLSKHVDNFTAFAKQDIGFDEDDAADLWRRAPDAYDYRDAAPVSLQVAKDVDCFKWKVGEGMWSAPCETELAAYREAFDYLELDEPDGAEVFEHWVITDWLADKLEERGETVKRDILGGLTIWGRATCGQMIAADSVIEDIAREFYVAASPTPADFESDNNCLGSGEPVGEPHGEDCEQDTPTLLNHYRCDQCGHEWEDQWSCACDDDCPKCGARHMSPYDSEELTPAGAAAQVSCSNCQWTGRTCDCLPISDIHERVAPGETMPAGDCPECGCLCHLVEFEEA